MQQHGNGPACGLGHLRIAALRHRRTGECMHHACQMTWTVPECNGYLQKEGVAIDDLQNPVRTGDEAREAERKDIVRSEFLHHLSILHHAQLGQH